MLETLFRLAARLPLRWLHAIGSAAGLITLRASPRFAARIADNVRRAGVVPSGETEAQFTRRVAREIGKGMFELLAVWFRPDEEVSSLVVECHGWELIERALGEGRGLLFLTPHLGCFDVSAIYTSLRMPLTVLYRPPKMRWLEPLMLKGRVRGQGRVVPTTLAGVRQMLKALRSGEAVGLLPDHVPGSGEGAWAPFFGRPAFTMTLAGRLQGTRNCTVLLAFSRRLPKGAGYALSFEEVAADLGGDEGPARLNAVLEGLIRRCPEQYLWSYNRYKVPAGVTAPGAGPAA
jgi:KDO2-lipid IV(A) lauroyltransferase